MKKVLDMIIKHKQLQLFAFESTSKTFVINGENLDLNLILMRHHVFPLVLKTLELRVADYMSPSPITIQTRDSLVNAIDIMTDKNIGNLVVKKNRHVLGILTEREILGCIVSKKKVENMQISDILPSPFEIVSPETRVIDAARLMMTGKKRLLVYEEKKLTGIITVTDMVRAFRRTNSNIPLEKVISTNLFTVHEDDDVLKAVKIMHEKKIGSVIVTKHNSPFGIFTERDLLVNVLSYGADLKNPVSGYCSSPLITAEFGIKSSDAARVMAENKIKRLVLTKKGKVAAIITARDIVDAFQLSFSGEDL